ncbi:MAG: PAS domain S-box protein, partial [Pseudomonadota bacterium]
MSNKANQLRNVSESRKRAEIIDSERVIQSPEDIKALSSEEIQQTIHELRVHQIELEMQNEELLRIQEELDASRAQYFEFYNLAPVGYCTISESGLFLNVNLSAATILGLTRSALIKQPLSRFILKEDQDIYYLNRKHLLETGEQQVWELRMIKHDGTLFWGELNVNTAKDTDGTTLFRIVLRDITERKLQENERYLMMQLMSLASTPVSFRECISNLTASLKQWSGCEAIGIRLKAGDDYPYYETLGFSPEFVKAESHLCAYSPDGKLMYDD